ncbi:11768_t:CDS:2, partial [Entrophospora sp. SA101]
MNNIICKLKKKKIEKQQWPIKEEWESIKIVMKNICEEIKYDIPNLPKEIDQYNIGQIKKEVKEIHKIIYTKCQYEEDRWRNEQRKHRKNVLDRILNNKNGTQELLLDPEKIKREVITHFQNITGDKHKNIDLPERWEAQYKPKTEINKNWYDNIMKEPSFEEWKMIIKQLPNDKACGPSQINNEMIKHAVNKYFQGFRRTIKGYFKCRFCRDKNGKLVCKLCMINGCLATYISGEIGKVYVPAVLPKPYTITVMVAERTAKSVCRYFKWLSIPTKVFNVGNYRRKLHGSQQAHSFFDPKNQAGEIARKEAATEALNDMIRWFEKENGVVAIFDATNSTRDRREFVLETCKKNNIQVMFIESICQDEDLIVQNIMDVKLSSPDYKNMDPEKAAEDFKARILHYEEAYETITENDLTYLKLINVGSQVVINRIQGYLQSRVVYYLMNLHILPRSIFFSRNYINVSESMYNLLGKIGGDSDLSPRGRKYAKALPKLIQEKLGDQPLTVWTSTMKRTIQTSEYLPYPKLKWKSLDELDAGVCD